MTEATGRTAGLVAAAEEVEEEEEVVVEAVAQWRVAGSVASG